MTDSIREPYNANKQSSFVELVIVVDNEVYKKMDENLDKVHKYCKDLANIINSVNWFDLIWWILMCEMWEC